MHNRWIVLVGLVGLVPQLATAETTVAANEQAPAPAEELPNPYGNGARLNLTEDGESYLRFITWAQIWGRYIQHNPGTTVQADEKDHSGDIGIRRARFLLLGQITPRIQIVAHIGINNQSFNNGKKPQVYFHDVWAQYQVLGEHLSIGGGLHYWNGISRMTNASTLTLMSIDAPILNWPTIEKSDQFARMLGVWAKGKLGPLDYRIALNHPFQSGPEEPSAAADYNPNSYAAAVAGYFMWQFMDRESNLLPYLASTYLGKKKVLNLGAGFLYHPKAMWSRDSSGAHSHDMFLAAVDAFVDQPLGPGALTAYAAYYYYDFGPDHLRSIGIMNIGKGGTTLNGAGNAYPVIGTGSHIYGQLGYLIGSTQLQPYVTMQSSFFEALDDPALIFEAGINYYLIGHHAKITLNYRNRPVFELADDGTSQASLRRSELILQGMVFL